MICCSSRNKNNSRLVYGQFYSVNVIVKLPFGVKDNKIIYKTDTSRIYFYKDKRIYEEPIYNARTITIDERTGDTVKHFANEIIAGYQYFIASNGCDSGYLYNAKDSTRSKWMKTGAYLNRRGLMFNLSSLVDTMIGKFSFFTRKNMADNSIVDVYLPLAKIDKSYSDTLLFYYVKDDVEFTHSFVSGFLDTIPRYRLYKMKSINKSFFAEGKSGLEYSILEVYFQYNTDINYKKLNIVLDKFRTAEKK